MSNPSPNMDLAGLLPTDRAAEEAIRAAERWLIKQGWKYTPADVGTRAKEILEAMYGTSIKAST